MGLCIANMTTNGPVRAVAPTGPVVFLHDTKIGCIRLVWAGAKKYFIFAMRRLFKSVR